jgi:hypothetical protein
MNSTEVSSLAAHNSYESSCYSLHRNLRLNFINVKPKKEVENHASVIRPATLKALIESKLEVGKPDLKKDFLDFVAYLTKMAIVQDEHCHAVDHKKLGVAGTKSIGKCSDASGRSSGHSPGGSAYIGGRNKTSDRDRTKLGNGGSSDSSGTGKQSTREPPSFLNM